MAFYTSILFLAFLLFCSSASAFNITNILDLTPDFSSFNSYLTQTLVADEINARQTITVLAVDNSAISAISGLPIDVVKNVLSVHVILDYYDVDKFQSLSNKTALLVTLFQATGLGTGQMGFLNATDLPSGVALGSAEPGAGLNAMLVDAVAAEPYNISVLRISSLIVPPGIGNLGQTAPPPPPPPPPAPTPVATPEPTPTPEKAPVPVSPGPSRPTPPPTASSPKSPPPSTAAEAPASPPLPAAPFPNSPAPSTPGEAPISTPPPTSPFPESTLASAPAGAPTAGAPATVEASSGTRVVVCTGLAAAAAAMLRLAAF